MKELTVSIKFEESTYKQSFLMYDNFEFDEDDPTVIACVEEAFHNTNNDPDDINDIKVRGVLQYERSISRRK